MTHVLALCFFLVSVTFVWRSFYKMRIVKTFRRSWGSEGYRRSNNS